MPFLPGDLVHVRSLGQGIVREVRNGDRYLVDVRGRFLVATGDQLTRDESPRKRARVKTESARRAPQEHEAPDASISEFLNGALLAGRHEVHIIHGRSGGKIKAALHLQVGRIPSIRSFRVDPRNAGVTIVQL